MPIPELSVIPSRNNPTTFSADMDQLLSELPAFVDGANALEQSLQLIATTGTSATSLSIGTGSKSLTTQAGKAWVVGAFVYLISAASIANRMVGQVTAYDAGTGALTVNVGAASGGGTFASWMIGLATSTATAAEVSVADGANLFTASTVETVLAELFGNIRNAATQVATAGGSANVLTASFTPAVSTLVDGLILYVKAASINTGAATFQADATAACAIVKGANMALTYADIAGSGHTLLLQYNGSLGKYVLLNPGNGLRGEAPIGMVGYWPGTTPPTGWIKRNGALLSRASWPELWAAAQASGNLVSDASWSTNPGSFSTGDGSTTFRIPDGRGLMDKGYHDSSGTFTTNTSRAMGSLEMDGNKSHTHSTTMNTGPGGTNYDGSYMAGIASIAGPVTQVSGAQGNAEATVRNAAYLPIIRAY